MFSYRLLLTFFASLYLSMLSAFSNQLISTESDPDAFVQDCVNVMNGDYCEAATDLIVAGPEPLILQRFYSNFSACGWKIFPQRFLVIGKDFARKSCTIGNNHFEWTLAFTGERSGGILPYSGWSEKNGKTKDPLKIDILKDAIGMVNTYGKDISGQTNHQNNQLHCMEDTCELILGDGSKRIYKKCQELPNTLLGEQINPHLTAKVIDPSYYLLFQETLPSGSHLFFTYDEKGHLISVEMKNAACNKIISWIHFSYIFEDGCNVHIKTSDSRVLNYKFSLIGHVYQLTHVDGSHCIPIIYEYIQNKLVKKRLPEGRFVEVSYHDEKVQTILGPNAQSGKQEIAYTFSYGENYTDVIDAMGVKTRYVYDKQKRLITIEKYDDRNKLCRMEKKFWGNTKSDVGLLLAKTISDGSGHIYSYNSFIYDKSGNVVEEKLYGNLTGKKEIPLQISSEGNLLNPDEEECHIRTYGYSSDGHNLLTKVGDCKGNQTLYFYKLGTNLLMKKFIYDKGVIKKRFFYSYNEDGACIKIIEDDDYQEGVNNISNNAERHIKDIKPKDVLPCVGLPEVIEEKALNPKTKKEILIKKLVNNYDSQSNLTSCDHYDSNNVFVFTETRNYIPTGQISSQKDAIGREIFFTYDGIGNEVSRFISHENKTIETIYDFHNKPIQIIEKNVEEEINLYNTYDAIGRKISSTDRFGNTTCYEYDSFHRLTKVVFPEVLDENGKIVHPIFSYTYDIFGNALTTTDPKGFTTIKSYNLRGDPTKISYPDGSFELYKYDTEGSLHRSSNRDQVVTVYEYDYLGRPIYEEISTTQENGTTSYWKKRSHQYNGFRCISEKENDLMKKYFHDSAGRIISILEYNVNQCENSPDSRLSEFIYDSLGRIQQKKVWFDVGIEDYSIEYFEYDLASNIVEKRIQDSNGKILLQKFYDYDLKGQCIEEFCLENGFKKTILKTTYDVNGEPLSYIDGLGNETKFILENNYLDKLGKTVQKKTIINPYGVKTEIQFDSLGRISSLLKKDSSNFLLSSEKYIYDVLGNKSYAIYERVDDGKIVDSQKNHWLYGPMGRLEEEKQAIDTSTERKIIYEYNSFGKLKCKIISGIQTPIRYSYYKSGNLSQIEWQNTKKELQISNNYVYDLNGNVVSANSLNGKSIQRIYNIFNQVTKETIKDGEGSYNLEYFYDRKGRIKSIILPDKSKISYSYDAIFGREVNRISSQGKILYTHTYDNYDIQGKLILEKYIGYVGNQEYEYNKNGQKTKSSNDFIREEYSRDSLGRIFEIRGNQLQQYSYNELSQLTSEKKSFSNNFHYDSLDNRIKSNNEELIYNGFNQLISQSKGEYSYDSQGNLLRKVLDGNESSFENNILSQLISIEKSNGIGLSFSYDALGRLLIEKEHDIKSKKTLSTKRYFYVNDQEIGTLTSSGTIGNLKIPGLDGNELSSASIAFEINGNNYVPLHDIAKNVVCLIDPIERQVIERYEYGAFGEEKIYNTDGEILYFSSVGNPWRFAEKRIDEKSGLILFPFRFYDPTIGRWISEDPIGFNDGPNSYAYLHNNPLNNLDRYGLSTESNSKNKFDEYFYGEVESHCFCEKHRTCKRGGDLGQITKGLPKITYNDNFEKHYKHFYSQNQIIEDYYDDSSCFDLGLPNLPNDLQIGFINGIWNNEKGVRESAEYISKLASGYNVHAVYNATHGTSPDILECKLGLNYIATEPVRQLHKMWNSYFEKSSAKTRFLMICHSQGAIHVRNALLDYPPEFRERILVLALAPGAYIYQETCAQVVHYRAKWWRDFVPTLDSDGAKRENGNIIILDSHPDAPKFDHEFVSPTYRERLIRHITNYINSAGKKL